MRPLLFTFVKMFHILESSDYFDNRLYTKLWMYMVDLVIFAMYEKIEMVLRTTCDFTTLIGFKALVVHHRVYTSCWTNRACLKMIYLRHFTICSSLRQVLSILSICSTTRYRCCTAARSSAWLADGNLSSTCVLTCCSGRRRSTGL